MQYHHLFKVVNEPVRRELHAAMTAALPVGRGLEGGFNRVSLVGLGGEVDTTVRARERSIFNATVAEAIDRLAESMSYTLLTITIPDGTWVNHRQKVVAKATEVAESLGLPREYAASNNLQYANRWDRVRMYPYPQRRVGTVLLAPANGYWFKPGYLVSARTTIRADLR